jgi:hypothetical protein
MAMFGRSRDRLPVSPGFFSVASDSSMCRGVDSASKNDYQVNPGGKVGRCVRLTIYHLHVPMSRNLGALISWKPVGLFRPVTGQLYLLHRNVTRIYKNIQRQVNGEVILRYTCGISVSCLVI